MGKCYDENNVLNVLFLIKIKLNRSQIKQIRYESKMHEYDVHFNKQKHIARMRGFLTH